MAKKPTIAEIGAAQRAMSLAQCKLMHEKAGTLKAAEANNAKRAAAKAKAKTKK